MNLIADLHIHSHYSRATSKDLTIPQLHIWAQRKGITIVGTGDAIHPAWLDELEGALAPAEEGLYALKPPLARVADKEVPLGARGDVRFLLSTEISSIYKRGDRVRKVHSLILLPHLEAARALSRRLAEVGNIASDGRPILGLDVRDLLEMVLELPDNAALIPAHIWTPWFSLLGSRSGFDSLKEAFGPLTTEILALETGLSSDPPMNWRVSALDQLALVSNSDAHSPSRLGREANLFDIDPSYPALVAALGDRRGKAFGGTIEFFPEEGKYHYDGHRKCGVRLSPAQTREAGGVCPVCGKAVTEGVLSRVERLADREAGERPPGAKPFESLVPLDEVVAQALSKGPGTKGVRTMVERLISQVGPELTILRRAPLEEISKRSLPPVAEAIGRMRRGEVELSPGYDGEYGEVGLLGEG